MKKRNRTKTSRSSVGNQDFDINDINAVIQNRKGRIFFYFWDKRDNSALDCDSVNWKLRVPKFKKSASANTCVDLSFLSSGTRSNNFCNINLSPPPKKKPPNKVVHRNIERHKYLSDVITVMLFIQQDHVC